MLKALSKNPANRYQSAAEMRADLVRVRSGQQPLAPMVMSEDERTALLQPARDGADPADQRRRRHPLRTGAPAAGATTATTATTTRTAAGAAGSRSASPPRVVVGLLALTGYLIFGGSPTVRQVAVPNVAGQQPEAARAALQAANLLATLQPVTSTRRREGPGRRHGPGRRAPRSPSAAPSRCRSATARTRPPSRR